ncbi:hypothetical protein BT63DRAFT_199664 [Microthyrium microscopicum]|uniref:Uncharacterized protein n=1 Tax=Microthyrium microscopicum TaxID=703497 RepID=A0A6A6UEK5_9PEZI|nr:hypothetical protein BT63DRAFT_199664 [Microthyrium microscopicum]
MNAKIKKIEEGSTNRWADALLRTPNDLCSGYYEPDRLIRSEESTSVDFAVDEKSNKTSIQRQAWLTKPTGPHLVQDGRDTGQIRLLVYPGRIIAKTFNRKCQYSIDTVPIWVDKPQTFEDLFQIIQNHSSYPYWHQVTHILAGPEFHGYPWQHRWPVDVDRYGMDLTIDQCLFQRIVRASFRTKRAPLCAPDYLFYSKTQKKWEIKSMFRNRGHIKGLRWTLDCDTKNQEQHPDWLIFCDYVKDNIPTGKFVPCEHTSLNHLR